MLGQVTKYGTLPHIPSVPALPGGVPQGPWSRLYHLTPGASVPSPIYPALQMSGASGFVHGLDVRPRRMSLYGLGQTEEMLRQMTRSERSVADARALRNWVALGGVVVGTGIGAFAGRRRKATALGSAIGLVIGGGLTFAVGQIRLKQIESQEKAKIAALALKEP